ncbi:sugar kinase [Candidatus Micrarchaeota archaeon]|nr:sugar kinase [Candidatus Micrarchaeota archaeon]
MPSPITCAGSIALDTTETPFKKVEMVLGGAASYFSISSAFFAPTFVSSIVGGDFPSSYRELLSKRADLGSVIVKKEGKTFHFDSSFSYDLYHRHANKTELNVLAEFDPQFSSDAQQSSFLYLATMPPQKQIEAISRMKNAKLIFMDTIEHYVKTELETIKKVFAKVNGVVLNDAEVRMLTGEHNLVKCGLKIKSMGPKIVIIKKGEHGSLLFFNEHIVPFPAFPLEDIVDPTGAGDSFAGGLVGYLASVNAISPTLLQLKSAMAYANVMGSLAVGDFSVDRLVKSSKKEIDSLYGKYCELMRI